MPVQVIAPTVVRHAMQHRCFNGRPADCIVDVSVDETGSSRSDAVLAAVDVVVGAWQDNIASQFSNTMAFTGCRYLDLDSTSGIGGFRAPIGSKPVSGVSNFALQAPSVAFLVHKACVHDRTQRAGRMFLPGVGENHVDDGGIVVPSILTTWNTKLAALKTSIATGTLIPVSTMAWRVVHVTGHTGTPVPGYPNGLPNAWNSTDVSSVTMDTQVATQRRRLRK